MDLLSICSKIWKHKIFTIPIIVLTLFGISYEFAIKPPVYQASASLLMVGPEATQTNHANPYVNNADDYLSVIANVLVDYATTDSTQQSLVTAGAAPGYQVTQSAATNALPIIQITGVGHSAQEAILSASLVAASIRNNLSQIQESRHIAGRYQITTDEVIQPTRAKASLSGKSRTLIAILGLGIFVLLIAVSVGEARDSRRRANTTRSRASRQLPNRNVHSDTLAPEFPRDPSYRASPRRGTALEDEFRSLQYRIPGSRTASSDGKYGQSPVIGPDGRFDG